MAAAPATFQPRDALANAGLTTLQLTAIGSIFAGVQNALRKQNVGAMGVFTRSGGIIVMYAGVGLTYQFTLDATANLRQKDDSYNEALAGFAAGSLLGIPRRSVPYMLGAGFITATTLSAFRYTNGLWGYDVADDDEDEVQRKEAIRKMRRRPLSETIEQLGEGRGIYAPGWEERRRERLLAKYGIDVNEAKAVFQQSNIDRTASL